MMRRLLDSSLYVLGAIRVGFYWIGDRSAVTLLRLFGQDRSHGLYRYLAVAASAISLVLVLAIVFLLAIGVVVLLIDDLRVRSELNTLNDGIKELYENGETFSTTLTTVDELTNEPLECGVGSDYEWGDFPVMPFVAIESLETGSWKIDGFAAQPVGVVFQAVGYHQATLTITHKTPSKVTLKLKPINRGK